MKVRVEWLLGLGMSWAVACSGGSTTSDDGAAGGAAGTPAEDDGAAAGRGNAGAPDEGPAGGQGGVPDEEPVPGGMGASGGQTGGAGGDAGMDGSGGAGGSGMTAMGGTAGTPPPPVPANCGELAECDGFEGFAAGPLALGKFSLDGGRPEDYVITEERAHSGKKAIKVSGASGNRAVKLSGLDKKTAGGKSVFARVWMFFPQLPVVSREEKAPHYKLINFFETAPNNKGVNVSAGIVGRDRGRMLYISAAANQDCASDGATLPANKWTCVEMRADSNGFQAWIDGQTIGSSQNARTGQTCWEKHDRVLTASFGYHNAAATLDQPLTFFMDDIAVDEKRVGCN